MIKTPSNAEPRRDHHVTVPVYLRNLPQPCSTNDLNLAVNALFGALFSDPKKDFRDGSFIAGRKVTQTVFGLQKKNREALPLFPMPLEATLTSSKQLSWENFLMETKNVSTLIEKTELATRLINRLMKIYLVLQEVENPLAKDRKLKRQNNSYVLTLVDNHLKWESKLIISSSPKLKEEAIKLILKTIKNCLLNGYYQFNPQTQMLNDVTGIKVQDLVDQMCFQNLAIKQKINESPVLTEMWVKILLTSFFQFPLQQITQKHLFLLNAMDSIETILSTTGDRQNKEIEHIKKTYFSQEDLDEKTLGGLDRNQIRKIISQLNITELANKFDYDLFLLDLRKLIFFDPTNTYGFNTQTIESFREFFKTCELRFLSYENFIQDLLKEDPAKSNGILKHFIKTVAIKDDNKDAEKQATHESTSPSITKDEQHKALDFYEKHNYQDCIEVLLGKLKRALILPNEGFANMVKQLCALGVQELERRNHAPKELEKLRQTINELTEKPLHWEMHFNLIQAIAKKLSKLPTVP